VVLKSRSRGLSLFLAVLAMVLLASSCGGSDDDVATEPAATEEASTAGEAETGEPESADDGTETSDDPATDEGVEPTTDEGVEPVEQAELPDTSALDDLTSKPVIGADLLGAVDELVITDVIEGDGDEAVAGSSVSMQYVGVLATDGTQFDASWDRGGAPFEFVLGQGGVIAGWDQGIEGMKVGGRRILAIPSDLAYGDQARGDVIGADADLLFVVDMIGVEPPAAPPEPAPPVPEDALGSFEELNIIELTEGTGDGVVVGDIIEVQYVGVNADDGVEFDSSWSRGAVPLRIIAGKAAVIEGWNEGLLGMQVGGERVLQIPSALAYGEGDLVFRVHLEKRIEAPYAHTVEFGGIGPEEIEVETITDGSGDGAEVGDAIDANIAVLVHSDSRLLQSSWEDGEPTGLFLQPEALLPGLNEGLLGIKAGELRQIILPTLIAYPDGFPAELRLIDGDAIVFIVEVLAIQPG
jgi:peptidylprolyl isomerase